MICRDISDRKESEVALLESEERYRMLAENPFDLIVELDENAHFIYVSPNFETIRARSCSAPALSVTSRAATTTRSSPSRAG